MVGDHTVLVRDHTVLRSELQVLCCREGVLLCDLEKGHRPFACVPSMFCVTNPVWIAAVLTVTSLAKTSHATVFVAGAQRPEVV